MVCILILVDELQRDIALIVGGSVALKPSGGLFQRSARWRTSALAAGTMHDVSTLPRYHQVVPYYDRTLGTVAP